MAPPENPDDPRPAESRDLAGSRWLRMLWLAGVWATGMWVSFYPMLGSGLARTVADPGDSRYHNYVLEHIYQWTQRAPLHLDLWSPPMFWPHRGSAAYSETLLGVAPLCIGGRLLGVEPDTAFQLLLLLVCTLNFVAAYLLLRRPLEFSAGAAATGAFLFSFANARMGHVFHPQLLPQFFSVWAVHAALRVLQSDARGRPTAVRWWLATWAASVAGQLYASIYLGWFLGFSTSVAMLVALLLPTTRPKLWTFLRRYAWELAAAVVLLGFLVLPLAQAYSHAAREVGYRSFEEAFRMVPRPHSWLYMGTQSWLYGWLARRPPFNGLPLSWEHNIGLGLLTTVLVVLGFWRERQRPAFRVLGLTYLVLVLLGTVYPGSWTPWEAIFRFVPAGQAIRAVARIGIFMLLAASVGLAAWVEKAWSGRRRWAVVLLLGLCLVEQLQTPLSWNKEESRENAARLLARVGSECDSFYYAVRDDPRPFYVHQIDALWAGLSMGKPTLNGYSGNYPPGWKLLANNVKSDEEERALRAAMGDWVERHGLDADRVCWLEAEPHG